MASQTWNSLQVMLAETCVKGQPPYTTLPQEFTLILPQATSYAEERIFTDIPFLGHRTTNSSLTTTFGSRTVNLTNMVNTLGGPIILPEEFRLITPAGASPQTGTRIEFRRGSTSLISTIWPNESTVQTPTNDFTARYWALDNDHNIIYAPTADGPYIVEISGLFQPTPISSTNQQTYISTTYPALLEAACMVFLAGALKQNYGQQSDDARQAVSWETQYRELMMAARDEERRRRGLKPDEPAAAMPGAPAQ